MTVSSTTNRKSFTGDAVTTSFGTSPVVFFNSSELVVQVVTTATGAATTLVENTDFTVTGGSGSTGTVNLAGGSSPYGAPASTETLVVLRVLPFTQGDDFVNNDINDAEVLEDRLDKITMLLQQLDEVNDRTLRLASSETATDALTELPFDRASKFLAFNASKELIASAGTTGTSTSPVSAFMDTVLDDATAAEARTTLGAQEDVLTTIGDSIVATTAGAAARLAAAASVAAHATTCDPWVAREVTLTGSAVTFTDIADAPYAGAVVWIKQNAAHVWTNGAVFNVQGNTSYTAVADDWIRLYATTASTFEVTVFRASGRPVEQSCALLFSGEDAGIAAGSTVYFSIGQQSTTEANNEIVVPYSGTFKNFYANSSGSPSAGQTFTFTLRKNEADSALTATISDTNINANDTSNTVSVAAGDRIAVKVVTSAGASTAVMRASVEFVKTSN